MNQSVPFSEGDDRYKMGDLVEYVVAVMDTRCGVVRLQPGVGEIVEIHTESVTPCENPSSPIYIDRESPQYQFAQKTPSLAFSSSTSDTGSADAGQVRVTGFDIRLTSVCCWAPDEVPDYYLPKSTFARNNLVNLVGGVSYLHIPARHVIRHLHNHTQSSHENMMTVLFRFFRRAPYGWLVLFNEPFIGDAASSFSEEERAVGQALENFYLQDVDESGIPSIITRRVVGEVMDFGLDYDGELKLIIKLRDHTTPPPRLDNYLFHGAFSEVARNLSTESHLYKLPYRWIHDAYDQVHNGEVNYYNVLKHILCDTLLRYRVKTVKNMTESGANSKNRRNRNRDNFYFGFTEDGFHFAKTNRRVLATEITPQMLSDTPGDIGCEGYEIRHTFHNNRWLNLRPALAGEKLHTTVKRGYIIYARVIERSDRGQTTLEWCTPTPGLDLLRVFLVTDGQSPIFRNLSNAEILDKMKDRDGQETLASQLFLGLIDPEAHNKAIDYIKQVLIW